MTPRLRAPALAARDRRALAIGAWIVLPALALALLVRPQGLFGRARLA